MVYLDNAATTRVTESVFEAMKPYFCEQYANPSAIYTYAGKSMKAINEARQNVAQLIGAQKTEIYFTSGGSEADNWAIKSVAETCKNKGKHIITSKIEHHAVLHTCEYLERQGYEVTYINTDKDGVVDIDELEANIRPDTILISIMSANNEIGTIQPIEQIGKIAKSHGVLFHTDAVQAYGHIPLDVKKMNIDLLSASGHKFNGPKGAGFLYVRANLNLEPFMHGGAQERRKRAGTLNTPGIVGMGAAAREAKDNLEKNMTYTSELRDYFIEKVLNGIAGSSLNGHISNRLPGNCNFCFENVEGESALLFLDQKGVYAASGSACTTGNVDPSHVLMAIGVDKKLAHSSLRFSLSHETTREELDYAYEALKETIDRLRNMLK